MKYFKAIAAMSENRVIGDGGRIPWHLPEDFKWFKQTTLGNIVVMGRKTFASLGKPLPFRKNFILTRHPKKLIEAYPEIPFTQYRGGRKLMLPYQFPFPKIAGGAKTEIRVCTSLRDLNPLRFPGEIFICGGAQIYAQALPLCSDLYLTLVKRVVTGDAFFPPFEHLFEPVGEIMDRVDFKIIHYRRRGMSPAT